MHTVLKFTNTKHLDLGRNSYLGMNRGYMEHWKVPTGVDTGYPGTRVPGVDLPGVVPGQRF